MAFTDKTLDKMLDEIDVSAILRCSIIIPSKEPGCPKEWAPPVNYGFVPNEWQVNMLEKDRTTLFILSTLRRNCRFLSQKIEERRQKFSGIDEWTLRGHSEVSARLIGLALENAFYHGNQNNPDLPVYFNVFEGENGLVLSIKDSGNGFDYRKVTEKAKAFFEKVQGVRKTYDAAGSEKYFQRWGTAFWGYIIYPVDVSFEDNGSRINLLFRDSECYDGRYTF